jgi:Mor family transcriptional regulator
MQLIVKQLTETVGFADTMEIVRRWGGRELYVPRSVTRADPLALTLGIDTAMKLVEHFGGNRLSLPKERNALLDVRNQAIVAAFERGESHQDIALQFGLRRQSVAHIIKSIKELEEVRKKFAVSKNSS